MYAENLEATATRTARARTEARGFAAAPADARTTMLAVTAALTVMAFAFGPFLAFTDGAGLKFHFLHQRKKMARKAGIAADAGHCGLPRFAQYFFLGGVHARLVAPHAREDIMAPQQQA